MGTQLALTPRWELVTVVFGEVVASLDGTLVGLFWFIINNVVLSSASTMSAPRVAAASSSEGVPQRIVGIEVSHYKDTSSGLSKKRAEGRSVAGRT